MRLQTLSEARWILTFFALLAVAASFFALWLSFFFLLLFLCTVAFFRDPERMVPADPSRSEEHTSELQSHHELVCRLLLEKKKENTDELKSLTHIVRRHQRTTQHNQR